MMTKEQAAVELYELPDPITSESRTRFAARVVLETSLIYDATFIVFTILSYAPSRLTGETFNLIGVSVRPTRFAKPQYITVSFHASRCYKLLAYCPTS
jgi:hypothetical protein